jgi:beta-lactam-binding protein with PASTA domain
MFSLFFGVGDLVVRDGTSTERRGEGSLSAGEVPRATPTLTPGRVEVPDVRGLTAADARDRILEEGLSFSRVEPVVGPAGVVVATTPAAGEAVGPGTRVVLVVGTTPDRVRGG